MSNTANLKKDYLERIVPALQKEFNYSTVMQVPVLKKIVINQGLGGHHRSESSGYTLAQRYFEF